MRRRIAYVINHMDVGLWRDTHLVLERRKFKSKVQRNRVCVQFCGSEPVILCQLASLTPVFALGVCV